MRVLFRTLDKINIRNWIEKQPQGGDHIENKSECLVEDKFGAHNYNIFDVVLNRAKEIGVEVMAARISMFHNK